FLGLESVYSPKGILLQTEARDAYSRMPALPAFEIETVYESEAGADGDPTPLRARTYWSQLSAIGGVFYGHRDIWEFRPDTWWSGYPYGPERWQQSLDTPGSNAMHHLADLYATLPWQDLVPSELSGTKALVTAGGSAPFNEDYVAAAAT